jgi:hypothetical protein
VLNVLRVGEGDLRAFVVRKSRGHSLSERPNPDGG